MEKFRITKKNIYNFDKKKFLISMGVISVWVMTHEVLKSSEIIGACQNGNKEWVLLLTTICAVASSISPILIYRRESSNFNNT